MSAGKSDAQRWDYDEVAFKQMVNAPDGDYVLHSDYAALEALLLDARAEVARLTLVVSQNDDDLEEVLKERDWAQECLQNTHIALGGDGEWAGKLPPEMPPDSGDLHYDVPALAEEVLARAERAEALAASKQAKIDALMLEYCPGEMTQAQRDGWVRNQCPTDATDDDSRGE